MLSVASNESATTLEDVLPTVTQTAAADLSNRDQSGTSRGTR